MANPFKDYIVRLQAGDPIFKEGDPGTEMYIIQAGKVEIYNETPQGRLSVAIMEKGDFFGEMALLDGAPHAAAAQALEDVELIEINSTLFDRMIKGNAEIAVRMLRKLSIRLRETNRKHEGLLASIEASRPAEEERAPQADRAIPEEAAALPPIPPEAAQTRAASPPEPPAPEPAQPVPAMPPPPAAPAAAAEGSHAILISDETNETFSLRSPKAAIGRFDPVTGLKPEVDLSGLDINRSISRQHARVSLEGGVYYLCEEPGALNGTFINGRKLITGKPARIKDGDAITLGMVKLTFREARKG